MPFRRKKSLRLNTEKLSNKASETKSRRRWERWPLKSVDKGKCKKRSLLPLLFAASAP